LFIPNLMTNEPERSSSVRLAPSYKMLDGAKLDAGLAAQPVGLAGSLHPRGVMAYDCSIAREDDPLPYHA
jgi:hypothetical protein